MSTSKPRADTLQSRVLRWTPNDVMNSALFSTRIKDIPMEFPSTLEYLAAFRVPLLEEVRTQVHQALEKSVKEGDCVPARVTKFHSKMARNQDPSMRKFNVALSRRGRQSTSVRASDLILLCSGECPRWDSRLECLTPMTHHKFVLASAVCARAENPDFFTATAYLPDGSPVLEKLRLLSTEQPTLFAVLLGMSLIPADRIWKSINPADSKTRMLRTSVLQEVLRIYPQMEPSGTNSLTLPQEPEAAETLQLVGDYCKSRRLNDSQGESLNSVLAGLLSTDATRLVRLVQGPPGTGKTAMLVPLISVLGSLRFRTLVSAPTNTAVLEVCNRVISGLFTQNSESEQKNLTVPPQQEMFSAFCSRIKGPAGSQPAGPSSPIQLWEVVLVGSVGKMEPLVKGTVLESIFLPYRIRRLTAALSPTSGWKSCLPAVEQFLTNAIDQFAENPGYDADDADDMNEANDAFWRFAKNFMEEKLLQMEKHLLTLTSELPRCHINVRTSKAMISTSDLMKKIVYAMPRKAPVQAPTWFSDDRTTQSDALLSASVANLSLSDESRSSSEFQLLNFLQAKEALLIALASRAGCNLLATEHNPRGRKPAFYWFESQCFTHASLVFCTVSTAGKPLMDKATFQCAIIDEASQMVEAESTIVSGKRGLKQLILVGDHKQLPAVVMSKVAEKSGYGRSLFDRLQTLKHGCRHMLNIQYRMKPEISRFPNSQFYGGGVQDGANVLSQEYGRRLAGATRYAPYAFINCRSGADEALQKGFKNSKEVAVVIQMVQHLGRVKALNVTKIMNGVTAVCKERHIEHLSIGIISPYAMQVQAVKHSLGRIPLQGGLEVEVKTVDGFQGNERDVIIFTAVRANPRNQIGFVHDQRRLNVAITRGRYCVWIVGNANTLSGGGKVWKTLISDAKARNCFFNQSN